jgi:hypothetical protein
MTFVICLNNEGYEAALELRKIYQVLPPEATIRVDISASLTNPAKTIFTTQKLLRRSNSRRAPCAS